MTAGTVAGLHLHLCGATAPPFAGQRLMATLADKDAVRDVSQVEK